MTVHMTRVFIDVTHTDEDGDPREWDWASLVDELDDESEDGAFIPAHVRIITISAAAATGVLEDDPTPVTDA